MYSFFFAPSFYEDALFTLIIRIEHTALLMLYSLIGPRFIDKNKITSINSMLAGDQEPLKSQPSFLLECFYRRSTVKKKEKIFGVVFEFESSIPKKDDPPDDTELAGGMGRSPSQRVFSRKWSNKKWLLLFFFFLLPNGDSPSNY